MPRQRADDCSSRTLPLLTTNACLSISRFVRGLDFLTGSAPGFFARQNFFTGQRRANYESQRRFRAKSPRAYPEQSWQRPEGFARDCNNRVLAMREARHFPKRLRRKRNQETGRAIYYNRELQWRPGFAGA